MHGLSVRDDHVVERKVEESPKRGKRPFLVPRRSPDPKLAVSLRQRVGEDERPPLGAQSGVSFRPRPS